LEGVIPLKIGSFAKKFDLNISTIRFYVNNGLLLPKMANGRYDFDSECHKDMEKILQYKKYLFTLDEIQLLFFLEKASQFKDDVILGICGEILRNKREELAGYRKELDHYIAELDVEMARITEMPKEDDGEIGVPFSFIPDLYCPSCQVPLKLDDASISSNSLQKGSLWCDCGYRAQIEDGIIRCSDFEEDTPFKAFKNIESVRSIKEQFGSSYRMLIGKAYLWMYSKSNPDIDNTYRILIGPFTFNFLLEYVDKYRDSSIFIVFDPSLKRIEKLKKYLSGRNQKIVYIAGGVNLLPLKHQSCDLYIDDYSTTNNLFTFGDFSCKFIAPLLKRRGRIVGIFTDYNCAPKSLENFRGVHPNFPSQKMKLRFLKYDWEQGGVEIVEEKSIGRTTGEELHFHQSAAGEQLEVHCYLGEKSQKK
jgi:DNA-binding transcriptional MerR regulator